MAVEIKLSENVTAEERSGILTPLLAHNLASPVIASPPTPLPARSLGVGFGFRLLAPGPPGAAGPSAGPALEPPPLAGVTGMDDLVARVLAEIDRPTALVAQSMGGIVAVRAALERPELITHLTLTVTSGGVDMSALGAHDWRPDFAAANPTLPSWFLDDQTDLTLRLAELRMPVLLLWGDSDPISPVRVGQRLAQLLPRAELHVFPDADHDLGFTHAAEVAGLMKTSGLMVSRARVATAGLIVRPGQKRSLKKRPELPGSHVMKSSSCRTIGTSTERRLIWEMVRTNESLSLVQA
jgi:pimeloyl-ACP methyl ester carboxylesterase